MSMDNVSTIQNIYVAFGQGDVPAIIDRCTPDTEWGFAAGDPARVPWHHPVHGVAELPSFFQQMSQSVEFEQFEPGEFVHCGPHVMVDVRIAYRVRATGRRVEMKQIHWWTLDAGGAVARLVHYEDSAQVLAAVA